MSLAILSPHLPKDINPTQLQAPIKPKNNLTTMYTARIKKSKTNTTLKEILSIWKKTAKQKDQKAQDSESLTPEKKEVAEDSLLVVKLLKDCLKRKVTKEIPYIAYDESCKVHGIALKTFSKKFGSEIKYIAANPDNVVIFGNENATRGAGTAIITHIVRDIKAKKNPKDLHLNAYLSAVPFYEKLGFEKKPQKKEPEFTLPMVLRAKNMATFLKAHATAGIIKSKEPKAKALLQK